MTKLETLVHLTSYKAVGGRRRHSHDRNDVM